MSFKIMKTHWSKMDNILWEAVVTNDIIIGLLQSYENITVGKKV